MRETKIREAQGEAEAILSVQRALADSIKLFERGEPERGGAHDQEPRGVRKAADGKATKIIIPSNIQGVAGLATSMKEFFTTDTPAK